MSRNYILDEGSVAMKLQRMAYEIVENNLNEKQIILAGIQHNGSVIARNMQRLLQQEHLFDLELIDLTLDKKHPKQIQLSENPVLDGKVIILIDDVANSGRTMIYALKPFLQGYPRKIQTLALVGRTHKAFPIHLDYTGLSVSTTFQEHIYVEVEGDRITGAYLE